eukprot:symbB.v1.2.024939.t4/scaffold2396.1/size80221/5
MGSGASTEHKSLIEGKTPEEIAAALKELPPDHLAKIWAAVDKKDPCPGPVDCSSITVVAKDYKGMLEQPSAPKFKGALAQIYVRNQPYGGSDKSSNGHRYDSMCIVNGMINSGMSCQLIHYTHEEHDKFFELCKSFDFVIVRCNPGQIKADGGDQQKFDDGMRISHDALEADHTDLTLRAEEALAGHEKVMAEHQRVVDQAKHLERRQGTEEEGLKYSHQLLSAEVMQAERDMLQKQVKQQEQYTESRQADLKADAERLRDETLARADEWKVMVAELSELRASLGAQVPKRLGSQVQQLA